MLILILILLGGAALYWYSLRRHPYRRCPACGSSGRHDDRHFSGAYGRCRTCMGGKMTRLGVRLLMPGLYREIKSGRTGRNY